MFQTDAIVQLENGTWSCRTQCRSVHTAEEVRSGFIGPVRQISMFADLYREGKEIVLEGPDRETVEKLADILNHSAEELLEECRRRGEGDPEEKESFSEFSQKSFLFRTRYSCKREISGIFIRWERYGYFTRSNSGLKA